MSEANEGTFLLVENGEKVTRLIDSQAAKVVAKHLGETVAFDSESKTWSFWTGTHWQVTHDIDKTDSLDAKVVDEGCGRRGYHQRYLNAIVKQMQLTGVLKRPSPPESVVPFANGLLDIKTGELKPATPSYSTDWVLPHNYDDTATCENIKAWLLDAVDKDELTFQLLRAWLAALIRGIPLQYLSLIHI